MTGSLAVSHGWKVDSEKLGVLYREIVSLQAIKPGTCWSRKSLGRGYHRGGAGKTAEDLRNDFGHIEPIGNPEIIHDF